MLLWLDAQNFNAKERHFILPLVIQTFIMQSIAFITSISQDRIKLIFSLTNKSYIFKEQFLLLATMTKAMSANSQQLLIIILFLCEVITLNKINMNFLFLFILFLFSFIHPRSWQNNQALDSTLIFIIYNSRTRLQREIIKQNSKLDHAINFVLPDQDTTNRIELRKTVKIGV